MSDVNNLLAETGKNEAEKHREHIDEMFISWLIQNRDLNDEIIEAYRQTRWLVHEVLKTCTMFVLGFGHQISHL